MTYREQGLALVSGLGGGLDVLNASLLLLAARAAGGSPALGSVQPVPLDAVVPARTLPPSGLWVGQGSSVSHATGSGLSRFAEPALAGLTGEDVLLLSRRPYGSPRPSDVQKLGRTLDAFRDTRPGLMVFVDGGGDSLVLREGDTCDGSEHADPFGGGDAAMLEALSGFGGTVLAVVSAGLDVDQDAFEANLGLLGDGYYGCHDFVTGETEGDTFPELLDLGPGTVEAFLDLAERVLVLDEGDIGRAGRFLSHTATVTYRALRGEFGPTRTWVPWEPRLADGSPGVVVQPGHARAHFIDAGAVHGLKLVLNGRA